MLKDYREDLIGTPSDEQIKNMLNILAATLLTAMRMLPDLPENQAVRQFMDAGAVAALYQKVSHKLTREEFDREVQQMLEQEREEDRAARRCGTILS